MAIDREKGNKEVDNLPSSPAPEPKERPRPRMTVLALPTLLVTGTSVLIDLEVIKKRIGRPASQTASKATSRTTARTRDVVRRKVAAKKTATHHQWARR